MANPAWMDDLEQGSFRGVPFELLPSVTSRIGRRSIANEVPGSDVLQRDDLGRKARRFHVSCVIIGDDYMPARDALRDALEQEGPGTLVHPYWGTRQAVVDGDVPIVESTEAGGMATFEIDFVEVPPATQTISTNPTSDLDSSADELESAATVSFSTSFVTTALSAMHLAAIAGYIEIGLSAIQAAKQLVTAPFGVIDDFESTVAELKSDALTLVTTPSALASAVLGLTSQLSGTLSAIAAAETQAGTNGTQLDGTTVSIDATTGSTASSLTSSASTGDTTSSTPLPLTSGATGSALGGGTGPAGGPPAIDGRILTSVINMATQLAAWTRPITFAEQIGDESFTLSQQAENDAGTALQVMVNVLGISGACRVIPTIPFASANDALSLRSTLMDLIDAVELEIEDEATFAALELLRVNATGYLAQIAAGLPNVISFTPQTTMPCLVIAHNVYGDASREQEVIDRNDIADPSAVPGGISLEVLSA